MKIISLIYIVEDDENISELIRATLNTSSYEIEVCNNYQSLLEQLDNKIPELILLDIMLPEKSGLEIIEELKQEVKTKDIPIIFLTAKGSELDKVKGLELGAEDYVTKPFGVLELLARIKTVLRRSQKDERILNVADLQITVASREVMKNGEKIKLTFKEFEILEFLSNNVGIVFSREKLLEAVWGYDFAGDTTRTVDMHIKSIRQKLGDSKAEPKYIETVRGYGYKFIRT